MDNKRVILRIALFSMFEKEVLKSKIFVVSSILLIFLCLFSVGCRSHSVNLNHNLDPLHSDQLKILTANNTAEASTDFYSATQVIHEHSTQSMSLAVVGDIMFHNTQLTRAYNPQSKSFDFSNIFIFMKPFLSEPDLLFGNLETTLRGPYGDTDSYSDNNVYGYSGYPTFNTPDSVLNAIVDSGFDFLSTANNHALDKNVIGLDRTIEQLDLNGLMHTGTFSEEIIHKPFEKIEKNGFSFAVVNYTYATNGIQLSDENMKRINTLNNYDDDSIELLYEDVRKADEADVDYVIVMMHYGNEYQEFENKAYQRKITETLFLNGADIVFGGHPHVLQPIQIYNEIDGITFDRPKLVIYSLGNFIASQHNVEKIGGHTDLGVVFKVFVEKIDDGKPTITGIGFLPTYTLWQEDIIMTIPINETYDWSKDNLFYSVGSESKKIMIDNWDEGRINFAKTYVVNHLMTYEEDNEYLSAPYYKDGYICYDLLQK